MNKKNSVLVRAFITNKIILTMMIIALFAYTIFITEVTKLMGKGFDIALKDENQFRLYLIRVLYVLTLTLVLYLISKLLEKSVTLKYCFIQERKYLERILIKKWHT